MLRFQSFDIGRYRSSPDQQRECSFFADKSVFFRLLYSYFVFFFFLWTKLDLRLFFILLLYSKASQMYIYIYIICYSLNDQNSRSYILMLYYPRTSNAEFVSISLFHSPYRYNCMSTYALFVEMIHMMLILRSTTHTGILIFASRCLVKNINTLQWL